MAVTQLIYPNTPGLIAQQQSQLAAGVVLNSLPLSAIQMNADFGNVTPEVFYQELYDGNSATLPISNVDGYQYQAYECTWFWQRRSTVSDIGGNPKALGGILALQDYLDPVGLSVSLATDYMVQGGATTDTNDGILGVWCFATRGRGLTTMPSGLGFNYLPDSTFPKGTAISQTLMQKLSAAAQLSSVIVEVFTDAGQGVNWTPDYMPALDSYVKPSWGRANGCYYQAAEVISPTGTIEPTVWPTKLGSVVVDGGVIWVCAGRGFTNGQSFSMPTSPVDDHVYTSGEMKACLTSWLNTGQANDTGPSGPGRVQRLQKSAPGGVVSTTVTYWDGNNQTVTNDGIVHCVAIFMRALPAYSAVPPAYNVMTGDEFLSGNGLAITEPGASFNDLQRVTQNVMNAAVRPEPFLNTGIANGSAPTLPTSFSGYAYSREEIMNVYSVADTGAVAAGVDRAIRLWVMTVDSGSGLVTCRVDYMTGGNQITTQNGSLDIVEVASRDANNALSGLATIGLGGGPEPAPVGVNGVPNGNFEIWTGLQHAGTQYVGVPSLWSISNNTADGYTTQSPGIDSTYSVGLSVGNAHAAANTQYVSLLSYPIAISPGDIYSWMFWAYAEKAGSPGTGITQGFQVRCHIRDINFANDVYFDLIPNQALGGSAQKFSGRFNMPQAGDSVVNSADGTVYSLSGTVPANPTYFYFELWNFKPNVSSAIFYDDVELINQGGSLDNVSPVNSAQSLTSPASLTQSGTSTTIDVAANSLVTPYQTVNYNAGSVDPGAYGTWYIYCIDQKLTGGAVTYLATQDEASLTGITGCVRFGAITTLPTGGGSGGGTGGGGGTTTLTITTNNLPSGTHGSPYTATLMAFGGVTPYTWALAAGSSLPSSLTLSSSGVISGTPAASGLSHFTVQVTDSSSPAQTATQSLVLAVG